MNDPNPDTQKPLRRFKVYVTIGHGDPKEDEIEVDPNASEEQIEALARECMFNLIEWSYFEIAEDGSKVRKPRTGR